MLGGNTRKPAVAVMVGYLAPALYPIRVAGDTVADKQGNRPDRFVRVSRAGGTRSNAVTDNALMTFECWASDNMRAEALANRVLDLLENAPGQWVDYVDADDVQQRAWIGSYGLAAAPAENNHPDVSTQRRWTFTVSIGIATNV